MSAATNSKPIIASPKHTVNAETPYQREKLSARTTGFSYLKTTFEVASPATTRGEHGRESFVPAHISLLIRNNNTIGIGQNGRVDQPTKTAASLVKTTKALLHMSLAWSPEEVATGLLTVSLPVCSNIL